MRNATPRAPRPDGPRRRCHALRAILGGLALSVALGCFGAGRAAATERPAKDEESPVVAPGWIRWSSGGEYGDGPGNHTARSITSAISTGLSPGTDLTVSGAYVELKTPGVSRTRGWGDPLVAVRSRFLTQRGARPDLDYTLAVKIPSGDYWKGLGTEEADFVTYLAAGNHVGRVDLNVNAGMTVVGLPHRQHRQSDSFLFGFAARAPVAPRTSVLLDVFQETHVNTRRNPFATYEDYGTAAILDLRTEVFGVNWDAGVFHPFDPATDIWGFTIGGMVEFRVPR